MRTALVTDIHGNHSSFIATLSDIANQNCQRIICLGDLAEPKAENRLVIDEIMARNILCLQGNHDEWDISDSGLSDEQKKWLRSLPEDLAEREVIYTHISPRTHKGYIKNGFEAWNVFDESVYRLIFVGHCHRAFIFGEKNEEFGTAKQNEFRYNEPFLLKPGERYIIVVGPVGYSRDEMDKARYAIYDDNADTVEMRTVTKTIITNSYL